MAKVQKNPCKCKPASELFRLKEMLRNTTIFCNRFDKRVSDNPYENLELLKEIFIFERSLTASFMDSNAWYKKLLDEYRSPYKQKEFYCASPLRVVE